MRTVRTMLQIIITMCGIAIACNSMAAESNSQDLTIYNLSDIRGKISPSG